MASQLGRNLLLLSLILLFCLWIQKSKAEEDTTLANSEGNDDSSSEETVEDSNESTNARRRRRRRSTESNSDNDSTKPLSPRISIPGLPDPAAIIKIAEILQTVGDQLVPILLEGIAPVNNVVGDRLTEDLQFLHNFKNEIEQFSSELKMK